VTDPRLAAITCLTFDCYGTLVDWESGILAAMQPILARHGVPAAPADVLSAYARAESAAEAGPYRPYREILRRTLIGLSRDLGFSPAPDEVDALVRALPTWEPFPDTLVALRALKGRVRLGVISNVDDELFAATAERLGVRFQWVVTAEQAQAYKPDPRVFELAQRRIGARPRELCHAASSAFHDLVPAGALGWTTVHVVRASGRDGPGAVPQATARATFEVPDLAAVAALLAA
jgi:2-haloalkanoic acid dehalogenase type II